MTKIDTHQHAFYPKRFKYSWTKDFKPLQGTFALEQYWEVAELAEVEQALFMECDVDSIDSGNEARFFLEQAANPASKISGVIAGAPLESSDFESYLDSIRSPFLKGIRRVFHMSPDSLMENSTLKNNLHGIVDKQLPFDICALQKQLPKIHDLIKNYPNGTFILDHCGIPDTSDGQFDDWRKNIQKLAKLPHLNCKISGIIAYVSCDMSEKMSFSSAGKVQTSQLRPYIETIIESFGWDRIVWGGDWPVCTLTASLKNWIDILDELLVQESTDNQKKFYQTNAQRIYQL